MDCEKRALVVTGGECVRRGTSLGSSSQLAGTASGLASLPAASAQVETGHRGIVVPSKLGILPEVKTKGESERRLLIACHLDSSPAHGPVREVQNQERHVALARFDRPKKCPAASTRVGQLEEREVVGRGQEGSVRPSLSSTWGPDSWCGQLGVEEGELKEPSAWRGRERCGCQVFEGTLVLGALAPDGSGWV